MTTRPGSSSGMLLIVATPIGNLGDISERALEALRGADLVVAEDTRRIAKLLSAFGIATPTESFHGDSSTGKRDAITRRLTGGATVAYVTDAGTPTISDPGAQLVRAAVEAGAVIQPVPGPSAITAALSICGFNADRFVFPGYPPRKGREREEFLAAALAFPFTVVIYEAPTRIASTLRDIADLEPGRACVVCRELTKRFEETLRGPVEALAEHIAACEPRGEFVVVLEGAEPGQDAPGIDEPGVREALARMLAAGMPVRACADVVARLTALSRNDAYSMALEVREGCAEQGLRERPGSCGCPEHGSERPGDGDDG